MTGSRQKAVNIQSRRSRIMEVAPITRAVRAALALSAIAFAGSGPAFAGTCTAPDASNAVSCTGDFADTIAYNIDDLTLVVGDGTPTTVTPPAGSDGISALSGGSIDIANSANITVVDGNGIVGYGATSAAVSNAGIVNVTAAGDAIGIYAYSPDGPADASNAGDLTVVSTTGLAAGIFTSGVTTDVGNSGSLDVTGYSWAAGIEAQGSDSATVSNTGTISATASPAGYAWGIYSTGGDGGVAIATADGSSITVEGGSAVGIRAYDSGIGGIDIANDGDITANGAVYATGISASTNVDGSNVSVINSGDIRAVSGYYATGIEVVTTGAGATGSISNSGNVYVDTSSKYAATGLVVSADGDASIDNAGSVTVAYGSFSYGALGLSFAGDANVTNSGDIDVTGGSLPGYGGGYGLVSSAQNGTASAMNAGSITVAGGRAQGISVTGAAGATATNDGAIAASGKYAYGVFANSSQGDTLVNSGGTVDATGSKYAFGVLAVADQGDVTVGNTGTVTVNGASTYGIEAVSRGGHVSITNGAGGVVDSYGSGVALGLFGVATDTAGDVTIDNAGSVTAAPAGDYAGIALGIYGRADAGSVTIANSGDVTATNTYTNAIGVNGLAATGDVSIGSSGTVMATASGLGTDYASNAIGIYASAPGGTAAVDNAGDVTASSTYGLADSIFATGLDADVSNSGSITATGATWAAGIEAQGDGGATVNNAGSIDATSTAAYSNAWGIYATGGDGGVAISTTDTSAITATGPYATGIFAYDGGSGGIAIDNGGAITATAEYYAAGIHAATNVDGSDIAVTNRGDISATSNFGSNGIEVVATGSGATGSAGNSGSIYVLSTQYYASTAGIVVSSDGAATIDNAGSITVGYGDYAYGALALAFNGDASVTSSGSIDVTGGFTGDGALASSQNGTASVTNSGSITVTAGTATGINVSGAAGATVDNSGAIDVTSTNKYGFGIQAVSSLGDTSVANLGDVAVDGKYGFGVLAVSNGGDVAVDNAGSVSATGKYTYGIEAVSRGGDVSIYNGPGGTVNSYGTSVALGLFGVATETAGDVDIENGGIVIVAPAGDYAGAAIGIYGRADAGSVTIGSSGGVTVTNTYTNAIGIQGIAASGDVTVNTSRGGVTATATGPGTDYASNAIGISVSAPGGTATVYNSTGSINATSSYGLADGIFASGLDVVVGNLGGITATGYTWAAGIEAQGENETTVKNEAAGAITATSTGVGGMAWGIYATGGDGGVAITTTENTSITATGDYATGIHAYDGGTGGITVENGGAISATGTYYATGIRALTNVDDSDIVVANSGDISAYSNYGSNGIEVVATGAGASGTATNSGSIDVTSTQYYASSSGIVVSSDGAATIGNSGSITVGYADYAYGALALAFNGDASVDNSGSIDATGGLLAYGAVASSQNGSASVDNSGTIVASSEIGTSTGISASGADGTMVGNTGSITAAGNMYAFGVSATSVLGDTSVFTSGDIAVDAKYGFGVLATSAQGDTNVDNAGSIDVIGKYTYGIEAVARGGDVFVDNGVGGAVTSTGTGVAVGIFGVATEGDVSITNAGSVTANGTEYASAAYGIFGRADIGDVGISSSGSVVANNAYIAATGVSGIATLGDVAIENSGSVAVASGTGYYVFEGVYATGLYGLAPQGSVSIANTGDISVSEYYGLAIGVHAVAPTETASVVNSGAITVTGESNNVGIQAIGRVANVSNSGTVEVPRGFSSDGIFAQAIDTSSIVNSGSIYAADSTLIGVGTGAHAQSLGGNASIVNSGEIGAFGGFGYGVFVEGASGALLTNSGSITANTLRGAWAAVVHSDGDAAISNSGDILADGVDGSVGVSASSGGTLTVDNSGTITARNTTGSPVIGIALGSPVAVVNNGGTIVAMNAYGDENVIAIQGSDGIETINNTGTITGAIVTNGGDDAFANGAAGVWNVLGSATNFGAGDDAVTNAADGTIRLADASLSLGSGSNSFESQGAIKIDGDSIIDMGTGPDAAAQAVPATVRSFPAVARAVPSLNANPLVNGGVIDFLDGSPDDTLTIFGDLGGDGSLALDMNTLNGTSDMLYVDGSIADGTVQTVDVALPAGTSAAQTVKAGPVTFAQVSGNSVDGVFATGTVSGYSPGGFIAIGVNVVSQIDTSNATPDTFALEFEAVGLNDSGVLAASIAPGVQSLMTSQIGTWRQRMGVVPRTDDTGLGAFIRYFYDKGAIDPSYRAQNFGGGGNFGFDQTNSGTEVGLNFEPIDGFNLGLTLAKSEGRQSLNAPGVGSDKLEADTIGLYSTWISPAGFYIDGSYRAMHVDARLRSAAGQQRTTARAGAINLETGYAWTLSNGLNIEPQLQYTWTTVDTVFLEGSNGAHFRSDDGDWQRGRLGLSLWKAFDSASGITWTPYGAISVVRTSDGGNGYTIGNDFFGSNSTKGTSGLVELGVGMQKAGFSATAGANWADGGALDSFVGGQVNLRYDW